MEHPELEEVAIQPQNTWTATLCAYFRDFLETDFKKSAAPKRNISNMDKSGLRMGFDIYQYPTLRESVANILNKISIIEGQYYIAIASLWFSIVYNRRH